MSTQQYYQAADMDGASQSTADRPDAPVAREQRWLLLGVLALGFLFQGFLFSSRGEFARLLAWYAGFWLFYLALFHAVCFRQAQARPLGYLLAGAAIALCVMTILQGRGYSDTALTDLNVLAIPALLMLHAQYVTRPLPRDLEGGYALLFLLGFAAQPFQYIGRFFRAVGALFCTGGKGKRVWLGIFIALPVLAAATALLMSADAVIHAYAGAFFEALNLSDLLLRGFFLCACALLFYSFLYGAAWGKQRALAQRPRLWNATAPNIVVGALLAVYAVFTAVQMVYLFGGHGLPAGLTYAEYARQGFSQLMWVAALNLAVFALCLSRVEQTALLRGLLAALLAATGVVLASAFTRLFLYIGAYGLTFRRIQALWFLVYLTAVLGLCALRLYRAKVPLPRACALVFIFWYVLLNLPDLTALYA